MTSHLPDRTWRHPDGAERMRSARLTAHRGDRLRTMHRAAMKDDTYPCLHGGTTHENGGTT